ncbi:Ig-like domain-containing protein [Leuconostoc falkenbergense]|uniref:Ig-like domain-containing protein n=1 Tax=Leuconostoc falkenbergense TaxID=2766470 RepID=UPI002A822051|nr:Ig-like domain-containing protein [Leuconostoc falkenbergense]MDY5164567.1 Ig-like domain-containing protein [Leuconostoc falkenbergense]
MQKRVLANGITLSQKTATIKVGVTKQVTVSANPTNASDASAVVSATTFSSSNKAVAAVTNDGTITGVAVGSTTITATSGAFTAEVAVTVTE